ncbi:MAG: hypothetical protein ACTSYM_01145 [Candidatus Baldrarchaeia archaeon]
MFKDALLEELKKRVEKWEKECIQESLKRHPERQKEFKTLSGKPVKRVYTPLDIQHLDYSRDLGLPGEYQELIIF